MAQEKTTREQQYIMSSAVRIASWLAVAEDPVAAAKLSGALSLLTLAVGAPPAFQARLRSLADGIAKLATKEQNK